MSSSHADLPIAQWKTIRSCSEIIFNFFKKKLFDLFDSLSKYSFWAETYLMSPVLNFYLCESTYLSENKNRFGSEIFLKFLPFFKNDLTICFLLKKQKNHKFTNLTWFWTTFIHSTLCSRHLRTKACKEAGQSRPTAWRNQRELVDFRSPL